MLMLANKNFKEHVHHVDEEAEKTGLRAEEL
jgi:hypothetical protein